MQLDIYHFSIFLFTARQQVVMATSNEVDCGCEHALVKAKTIKLVFAASPLRMYHVEARSKRMVNRNTNILYLI
jgi:hypothetical protein